MTAANKTGRFRGELSGSQCLSIELGEDKITGTIWSESEFSTTLLRDSISTAVSITKDGLEGVLDFLESPSVKAFDELKGLAFGPAAESGKNKNIKTKTSKASASASASTADVAVDVDVLYPTRYIGQEKDSSSSSASLLSMLKDPTSSFSKTHALKLSLTNSSSSSSAEIVSLHPEELVALQLQYWASKARAKQQESSDKKKTADGNKKKKQKQKYEKGVTLVVPGYFGQRERNCAKTAARLAGMELQHIHSRGLCATAAALFTPQSQSPALSILQAWSSEQQRNNTRTNSSNSQKKNPVVMFVHVNTHGIEVSLIECEQPFEETSGGKGKGVAGVNAMHYDRLVCVASGGLGGVLEGVEGGSVMKYKDKNLTQGHAHVHGKGDACAGHSHEHGHEESKGSGKKGSSGNGKGVSSAASSYSSSVTDLVSRVISEQLDLANLTASDISLVLHSGQGSPQDLHATLALASGLTSLQSVPLLPVPEEDPARGGSILTAAELDSSKQYIDLDDDHSILVHCLSIAEDVMSTSVGMLYVESEEMEKSFNNDDQQVQDSIQSIYAAGTIIRKADVGPVRKQVNTPPVESKEFSDGSVNFFGSHKPAYKNPAYPRQLLVQYEPSLSSLGEYLWHWRPVTDVGFPLLSDNGKSLLKSLRKSKTANKTDKNSQQKLALLSCKINFKMNESQGLLTLEHAQGQKVTEKMKAKSQVAKIAYSIGFFVLLVLVYYAYGMYSAQEEYRQDTVWLTEFYEKHAPHVRHTEEGRQKERIWC